MERYRTDNLIQKRPGVISISFSGVAFTVLCAYLALIFLNYVEWIPLSLVSLTLYGFVGMTAIAICVRGRITFGEHVAWYTAFLLICFLSTTYSVRSTTSFNKIVDMLKLLLFSLAFINIVNSKRRMRITMFVATCSATILYFYLSMTGQLEVDERLGESLTGNANAFAILFMIGAFCSVYFMFFGEKRVVTVSSWIMFILQLHALALSGSRKFFLMPVLLFGFLKIFSTDKKGRSHFLRNAVIGLTAIAVVWWALFNVEFLYDAIGYRMEGMVAAFTGEGEVDASSQIRQDMITRGLELWQQAPLIGHGIDTYKHISGFGLYAHNNFAELLSDLGLIGLVAYYWFYIRMIVRMIRRTDLKAFRWFWAICIACIVICDYGVVSYDMYPVHLMLLLSAVALQREEADEQGDLQKS